MNYLFVGEDEFSKDIKLEKIKQELHLAQLESFNFEVLYAKGLDLSTLQERLLVLPAKIKQRLILIKNAPALITPAKQYLLAYLKKPFPHVSLILDARQIDQRDTFFNQLCRLVKLVNFRQSPEINAFSLARQAMQKKIKPAIRLLRQLLLEGERPERILGALRYQLHRERLSFSERKKRLMLLLDCDLEIKTGKLKPIFALERLLLRLCCF